MAEEYREDVYKLQTWLAALRRMGDDIPAVVPDGFYGEKTADAVRSFQRLNGLDVTGVVDRKTWDAVYDRFLYLSDLLSPADAVCFFPSPGYCTDEGERSDVIMIVQLMLRALCIAYDVFDDVEPTGVCDEKTANAVMYFQELNGIEPTGVVDKATWNCLARSYNIFANHRGYTE